MEFNVRQFLIGESLEEKTRKYTRPHALVTRCLENIHPLSYPAKFGGMPRILQQSSSPMNLLLQGDFGSPPQVSYDHRRKRGARDFQEEEIYGKRKKLNVADKYKKLTEEIEDYTTNNKQSDELLEKKLKLRTALLSLFRRQFPGSNLHLVGSSCNGFASNTSDADFCLMLKNGNVDQQFEAIHYLKSLQRILSKALFVKKLQFIRAKVPILKFLDSISECECDININNSVGIRNTHLLKSYSQVDDRVLPLIMNVKRWAKSRNINDASQGTLSSYSLVLMVIHFLQCACGPPILVSLQETHPDVFDRNKPVDEISLLGPTDMIPRNRSNNSSSVGELLEQYFQYYALKFSFEYLIISVRLGRATPKYIDPEWKDKFICVEEPFDLTNTARAVYDYSKYQNIKKEFARAYNHLKNEFTIESIL